MIKKMYIDLAGSIVLWSDLDLKKKQEPDSDPFFSKSRTRICFSSGSVPESDAFVFDRIHNSDLCNNTKKNVFNKAV